MIYRKSLKKRGYVLENTNLLKIKWNRVVLFVSLGLIFLYFAVIAVNEIALTTTGQAILGETQTENFAIIRFVIEIINAEHLDLDREFISNIYDETKDLDDVWSETINDGEYARITFETSLTSKNDITIYPRIISGSPRIEVYEKNKNELIAEFTSINSNEYNKIFLTNLNGEQDTFDLLILGGSVEFDHIIDPIDLFTFEDFEAYQSDGTSAFTLNWTNVAGDNCDWLSDKGGTVSANTGPGTSSTNGFDHTLGTTAGIYAYMETSAADPCGTTGFEAHLNSSTLDADTYSINVSFWYHMFGASMGSLHLDVNNGTWQDSVWSVSGEQQNPGSDPYINQVVDLSSFTGNIYLRFRGVRGSDFTGDIAIDDINVTGIVRNAVPTTPTNIQCNDNNNCNITVDTTVDLNASGSTDAEADAINYSIEASLETIAIFQDATDVRKAGSGGGGSPSVNGPLTFDTQTGGDELWWTWSGPQGGDPLQSGNTAGRWSHEVDETVSVGVGPWHGAGCTGACTDGYVYTEMSSQLDGDVWTMVYNTTVDASAYNIIFEYYWSARGSNVDATIRLQTNENGTWMTRNVSGDVDRGGDETIPATTATEPNTPWFWKNISLTGVISDANTQLRLEITADTDAADTSLFWHNDIGIDNVTITENPIGATSELNTSLTSYTDVDGNYNNITNITVTVEVDSYDPRASVDQGTNDPDLHLEIYNGTDWITIGNFSLPATYTGTGVQTNNENFSLTTTDSEILSAWETSTNQDIRIKGIFMDHNTTFPDEINWTDVYVTIDGIKWINIGNHTETTNFTWNTTDIAEQNNIDLRARAIDPDGSNSYSSYFTKGSVLNISHGPGDTTPPVFTTIPDNVTGDYLVANVNADFDATDDVSLGGFYLNDTSNFTIDYSTGILTNSSPLFVGSYALNVTVNDSSLNINWTTFTVTVNSIVSSGSLSGTASITYPTAGDVQGTESNTGDRDVTYTLYRNLTSVSNPDTSTLAANFYSYIYNATGGQNYTANASLDTFDLTVNQNTELVFTSFNTTSPITYDDTFLVFSNLSSAFTLFRNGTSVSNNSEQGLAAGIYNFTTIRTDDVNYSNTFNETTFTISQAVPIGSLAGTASITYPTAGDVTGTESNTGDSDLIYLLYRNGTAVSNPDTSTLGVNFYSYIYNTTGGENYTLDASLDTFSLTVTQSADLCGVQFNETSPLESPGTFLVWSNCTTANFLTRNGTIITNNSEQSLSVGAYNFSTNRTDTVNYSIIFDEQEFRISPAPDTTPPDFTTIPSNVTADYLVANVNAVFDFTDETAISMIFINDTSNFTMTNSTKTLTNNSALFAGSYALNVTINDSSNNINWTTFTVTVNSIVSSGSLSGTSPITFGTAGDVQGTESNTGDGDVTYTLYRNLTSISNPDTSTIAAGFYSYIYNATGGQNYTTNASLDTFDLTVNKATSSDVNVTLNATDANITIVQDTEIYLNTTIITGDSGATLRMYNNGILINQGISPLNNLTAFGSVGVFNITGFYIESENYTGSFETWYVNVTETPDTTAPAVTSLTETPNDPATYAIGASYEFNATITDARTIDLVILDFDGINYTLTNFTSNVYNFTISDLAVGTYNYRWYANDTSGNSNNTESGTYTINQNASSLNLDLTPSESETFGTETIATGSNCPSQLTCILYRDGVSFSNPDTSILAVGTYNYTYNTTGNTNYTSNSVTQNLTIDQNTGSCSVLFNETSPISYPGTFTVWSNCTSTFTLTRNGTTITNNTEQSLAATAYNFTIQRTDTVNYSNVLDEQTFIVSQATGVVFTYLNNSRSNITIEQQVEIYLNGTLETGTGSIELYNNGTLINDGASPLSNLTNFTTIGVFNITTLYAGNENYTSAIETWHVNVTELDITSPQIATIYPTNTSYTSVQTELNYSATDNFELNTCWYSLNNGVTNTTTTCNVNITSLNSGQGSSTWTVYANDSKGNENSSSITFFVDSVNPTISFVSPTETNNSNLGRNFIQVNVTATDTNLDTITIRLYNSTNDLVRTNESATSPFFINYTGLSEGEYSFNSTSNDTVNNEISTATRNVSLVVPTLAIVLPENETYINNEFLLLSYTASLENFVWYNIDGGANTTITSNTTFNTTTGQKTFNLYANNTVGEVLDSVVFTVDATTFRVIYNEYKDNGTSTDFNQSSYEDLQNLSSIVLEKTDFGKIVFNEALNMTNDLDTTDNEVDLDANVNISLNSINVNSTALPNFNKSATLYLYNLTFSNPRILKDGVVCSSSICTQNSYSSGTLSFNVTGFTNYSAEETPEDEVVTPTVSGGDKGSSKILECTQDNECSEDETCWNNECAKLFDIKIIDFESPIKLGEFFDFTYFIKGVAEINGDIKIDFWIEKEGEIITSGSDVIYFGSFEEKTETTKLFLPSTFEPGVYEFYIRITHPSYSAQSHRTIEVELKEGVTAVNPSLDNDFMRYFIFGLIILAALAALSEIDPNLRRISPSKYIGTKTENMGIKIKDNYKRNSQKLRGKSKKIFYDTKEITIRLTRDMNKIVTSFANMIILTLSKIRFKKRYLEKKKIRREKKEFIIEQIRERARVVFDEPDEPKTKLVEERPKIIPIIEKGPKIEIIPPKGELERIPTTKPIQQIPLNNLSKPKESESLEKIVKKSPEIKPKTKLVEEKPKIIPIIEKGPKIEIIPPKGELEKIPITKPIQQIPLKKQQTLQTEKPEKKKEDWNIIQDMARKEKEEKSEDIIKDMVKKEKKKGEKFT